MKLKIRNITIGNQCTATAKFACKLSLSEEMLPKDAIISAVSKAVNIQLNTNSIIEKIALYGKNERNYFIESALQYISIPINAAYLAGLISTVIEILKIFDTGYNSGKKLAAWAAFTATIGLSQKLLIWLQNQNKSKGELVKLYSEQKSIFIGALYALAFGTTLFLAPAAIGLGMLLATFFYTIALMCAIGVILLGKAYLDKRKEFHRASQAIENE